ncbi:hypothetical protein Mal4_21200 [Maioricimonas rarisocia]|uniref:DUF6268 domain-containing protein n=1 Tax=Maioricimonas rarisocia TaxID=2528026 RepID=A0A517Z5Q9_9PLAN|nr:DUF6268 family outer membrane beta-barrel protein [Maioricimonas rarisocia]QDU37803.1 hypothetical protein Mal4_21200 [Maioricimonas rarisocia]
MGWPPRLLLALLILPLIAGNVPAQAPDGQQVSPSHALPQPAAGDGWHSFGHSARPAAPAVEPIQHAFRQDLAAPGMVEPASSEQSSYGAPAIEGGVPSFQEDVYPTQTPLDEYPYDELPPPAAPTFKPVAPPHQHFAPADGGWLGMRLKSTKATGTYLSGKGNTFGMTSLDFRGTLEFPALPGIFATPRFGWHFLDGPASTDLPGQLYNLSVDLLMVRPIGRNWMVHLAVAPSLYTDFDHVSGDSVRIVGRGLAFYRWSPTLQLSGGVVYLDRDDIPILPAAGLVYTPNDDTRIELMFPRPRIARRYQVEANHERWFYLTGELGGGTWSVKRTSGRDDVATYGDLRLLFGIDHKWYAGPSLFFEGGYVFSRDLEYESNIGNRSFTDTVMVRIGANF